jgi:L-2,4-diaminobutyric acid acetyltransferase
MWRVARDSAVLDLNSAYAYLLWARDFSATSLVARIDDRVCGFVSGYLRPDAPDTLMVWQIAVDAAARGTGLAGRLLDALLDATKATTLETTITEANTASRRLFASFAERYGAELDVTELFTAAHFPADAPAEAELLHRISPLAR